MGYTQTRETLELLVFMRKAVDVVDFVEDDEGEDLSDAVDSLQEHEVLGIMLTGEPEDVAFQDPDEEVVVVDQFEVHLDRLSHDGVFELFGHTLTVDVVGDLASEGRQVVLAVGVLDVGQKIGPFADQVGPPSHEVAGAPHFSRVDIGHGEHAAAE